MLASLTATASAAENRLAPLCIDPDGISASGISSGGYMAHQFHVAHSARIMGAGIIAGGPYACAGDDYPQSLFQALSVCSSISPGPFLGPPDPGASIEAVRTAARAGSVDDPAGLRGDRVFLFSGRHDEMVPASVVEAVAAVYRAFDTAPQIALIKDVDASHAMPTLAFGNPCDSMAPPFINACGYDLAGAVLQHIYGPLAPAKPADGELRTFKQAEFVDLTSTHGLGDSGFLYVPKTCAKHGRCRLHVAFHGCGQNEATIGEAFVRHAGYTEWAEANDIVILYPQTATLVRSLAGIEIAWTPRITGAGEGFLGSVAWAWG